MIYVPTKAGLRLAALAFKIYKLGQKPPQAKLRAWLGLASGLRPEPAHHYLHHLVTDKEHVQNLLDTLLAHPSTHQNIRLGMCYNDEDLHIRGIFTAYCNCMQSCLTQ